MIAAPIRATFDRVVAVALVVTVVAVLLLASWLERGRALVRRGVVRPQYRARLHADVPVWRPRVALRELWQAHTGLALGRPHGAADDPAPGMADLEVEEYAAYAEYSVPRVKR